MFLEYAIWESGFPSASIGGKYESMKKQDKEMPDTNLHDISEELKTQLDEYMKRGTGSYCINGESRPGIHGRSGGNCRDFRLHIERWDLPHIL